MSNIQTQNRLTEKLTVYVSPQELLQIREDASSTGISASSSLRLRYLDSLNEKTSSELLSSLVSRFMGGTR